jgi:hypothetical protein
MSHESPPTPPDREHRRKAIEVLPVVGNLGDLGLRAALAALSDIKGTNPKLYEQIQRQIKSNQESWTTALDRCEDTAGNYLLPKNALKGVIARSIIAGATQTAYALGEASLQVQLLNEIACLWQPEIETGPEIGPESESLEEGEA